LASDLPKWSQTSTVVEMNHHNLTGVEIHPMAAKTLTGIQVDKTAPSYLVFWGATGLATGVDAGVGAMVRSRMRDRAATLLAAETAASWMRAAALQDPAAHRSAVRGGATGSSTAAGTGGATGSGGAVGTGNAGGGSVGSTSATTTGSSGAALKVRPRATPVARAISLADGPTGR